jgi:hypothetical protein
MDDYRERQAPKVCDRCGKPFINGKMILLPYLYMENALYEKKWICTRKFCADIEKAFDDFNKKYPNYHKERDMKLYPERFEETISMGE